MDSTEIFERAPLGGTYVGVRFSPETIRQLIQVQNDHKVPNPLDPLSFHTTVIYSRKQVPWEAQTDLSHAATPVSWEAWDTQDGNRCLVLVLDCPYLYERWKCGMEAGATYDFPDYKPHITLSYNIGDFDPSGLPLPQFPIEVAREYVQPLKAIWAS